MELSVTNASETNDNEDSELAVRTKFNEHIVKFNPYKYPKNEEELNNITEAFIKKDEKVIKEYVNFCVANRNGKKLLVVKSSKKKKMIVLQDVYDIIKAAHIHLGHGAKYNTSSLVGQNYLIPFNWIIYFIDTCKICASQKTKLYSTPQHAQFEKSIDALVCELCISTLVRPPDSGFKHVLIYVNQITHYTIIRPLRTESVEELAFELMRIFADFEIPEKIGVSMSLKVQIDGIVPVLRSIELPFKLPVVFSNHNSAVIALSMANITKKYVAQLDVKEKVNWAITMGSLQWKLNQNSYGVFQSRFMKRSAIKCHYHAQFGSNMTTIKLVDEVSSSIEKYSHKFDLCLECQHPVHKVYTCLICKRVPFHFTCCRRQVVNKEDENIMLMNVVTSCFSCAIFQL